MSNTIEILVPDLGNFKDVAVIELLVKAGDRVEVETPLATLETEKATMELPSSAAGVIQQLHIRAGGTVNAGDKVATLLVEQVVVTSQSAVRQVVASPVAKPVSDASVTATPAPALAPVVGVRTDLAVIDDVVASRAHAGPSVRRFARELGVALARVSGSGIKGRITHDDVKAFVKRALSGGTSEPAAVAGAGGSAAALPRVPRVDFAAFGPVESVPLNRVQRISGPRLHASWLNLPHVTQFDEADITELELARSKLKTRAAQQGVKLTPLAFVMRACVKALQEFPNFNASLDESAQNLIVKKYCHIGFAADTPNGLLVPVVRDVDHKDVYDIARTLGELAEKARQGKLSANEMQGGCFTISSLGGIGGTAFTPIINAPEVAILGVSRAAMRPVWQGGQFVPRQMLPLSLSYDHRVIDGAAAARFTTRLAALLADPRGLLEAVL